MKHAGAVDVLLAVNDIPKEFGKIDITADLSIEFLPMRERQLILESCLPAWYRSTSQKGSYAFVRRNPPADAWDSDEIIRTALTLSRLIHPTSAGTEYAARLDYTSTNGPSVSRLGPSNGFTAHAYIDPSGNDWLTEKQAGEVPKLYGQYVNVKSVPPDRVRYAVWTHESAAQKYYVDEKWLLVTQGLEALIHTRRRHNTAQFVQRVMALAKELNMSLSDTEANEAYTIRSELVHQGKPVPFKDSNSGLYASVETVLRIAIRKAIEDPAFRAIFGDENSIDLKWPLQIRKNVKKQP